MNYALAAISAILLVLVFPHAHISWLAPLALAPLLVAALGELRPWRRFLAGWVAGIVYWFGVCYWIQFVLSFHGGVGDVAGWALFFLFCLAKGLHMAAFTLLAGMLMRRWWAVPAVAALWVAVEASHGFLGFAWLALGNAGIDMGIPMRLAPYTGVYGLSFIFMMMSTALALAAMRRPRMESLWLLPLPFLIFLPHLPDAERGRQVAVLVQPDISESEQWTAEKLERTERNLVRLAVQAMATGAERPAVIALPEVPAPFYYYQDPGFRGLIDGLARTTQASVIAGVVSHTPDGSPLNSAVLVSPQGIPVTRYDKVNLVPFGEFVPWPFGTLARHISSEAGDFSPGSRIVVSPVGEHKLGAFICYESVFPNFVRRFASEGAEVLFNISNDGYFGKSAARAQHLQIVRMRAAENRRWILRATNDGISATIDTAGRVRGSLPPYIQAASRTGFTWTTGRTFYTRNGDWFPLVCAIAVTALLMLEFRSNRGSPKETPESHAT